jgi:hypothetical protein
MKAKHRQELVRKHRRKLTSLLQAVYAKSLEVDQQDIVKTRIIISGAQMASWLAILVPLSGVVAEARETGTIFGCGLDKAITILIPQIPGYFILVAVCAVLRSSCYKGQPLGTDQADFIIVLLGNAAVYMVITYGFAKSIYTRITKAAKTRQNAFFLAGIFTLFVTAF